MPLNDNYSILISFSLEFVPVGTVDNRLDISSGNDLVSDGRQAITWINSDKPTDAYMRHLASMTMLNETYSA